MSQRPAQISVVAVPVEEDGYSPERGPFSSSGSPKVSGFPSNSSPPPKSPISKKGLEKVKKLDPTTLGTAVEEAPRAGAKRILGQRAKASSLYVPPDAAGARAFLDSHGWPYGLQSSLIKSCEKYPLRFFIIDDSGSMQVNDGHRIIGEAGRQKIIKCTRWSELTGCLRFHAELSQAAKAPTEFRFLNMAEPIMVGLPGDADGLGLESFLRLLDEEQPGGQTPLCAQILEVIASIKLHEQELRQAGQRAVVTVATDGEPTDGDLVEAMRELQHLPVWLVVRICCDTPEIIEYWNNVDSELEIDMDVLDDIAGEAAEIREANPWLYYSEPLHKLREFGSCLRELDLVDEAPLTSEQMSVVVSMLLSGPRDAPMPSPDVDFAAFLAHVKSLLSKSPLVFDPILRNLAPVVSLPRLAECYDGSHRKSSSCVLS